MFNNEMKEIKRAQTLAILALSAGIVALSLSTVKSFLLDRWVRKRENVACVPVNVNYVHPFVYRQNFMNPVEIDAKLKLFVEQYVHLTQDESIVNYHSVTNNERYDKAKLSKNKWQAIEMASGLEKVQAMKAYGDSNTLYKMIAESGVGWKFLIDDIIVYGAPRSGPILVTVRGQYQVTYDKAKVDIPHKLFGYKEIRYLILQGAPTKDADGNYLNKTGLFVTWSSQEDMSPEDREISAKRSQKSYLKTEDVEN